MVTFVRNVENTAQTTQIWNVTQQGKYFYCGKSFQDTYHLRLRRSSKHGGPKTFCCITCNKSFAKATDLKKHIQIERNECFVTCHVVRYMLTTSETKCFKGSFGTKAIRKKAPTHVIPSERVYMQRSSLSRHKIVNNNWWYEHSVYLVYSVLSHGICIFYI